MNVSRLSNKYCIDQLKSIQRDRIIKIYVTRAKRIVFVLILKNIYIYLLIKMQRERKSVITFKRNTNTIYFIRFLKACEK